MKFAIAFTCLLVACAVQARPAIKTFEQYKKAFNKSYANAEEEAIRKQNFEESLKYVEENGHMGVEINHLSDLSLEEFKTRYMLNLEEWQMAKDYFKMEACKLENVQAPQHMDLRKMYHLTPVRNQEACGSCWAFATVASTESAYMAHKNQSLDLSEQELVDCASKHGCRGDTLPTGLEYVKTTGTVTEQQYPYTAKEGQCRRSNQHHYKITDYCLVYPSDVNKIKQALAKTKTAIAAIIGIKDMNQFRHYNGKTVIKHDNGGQENWHAINIVGYGNKQGTDYWIIRNSWGQQWGEEGYGYFEQHSNLMHINEHPHVVLM